jgi:hypothetical protein
MPTYPDPSRPSCMVYRRQHLPPLPVIELTPELLQPREITSLETRQWMRRFGQLCKQLFGSQR